MRIDGGANAGRSPDRLAFYYEGMLEYLEYSTGQSGHAAVKTFPPLDCDELVAT